MVRFVVDTAVSFRPAALERLAETEVDVIVPAVVHMERSRRLRRDGHPDGLLDGILRDIHFSVECFCSAEALRFARALEDDEIWRRAYRDAMIAGHLGPHDVPWTTNPRDFLGIGLDAHQVHAA